MKKPPLGSLVLETPRNTRLLWLRLKPRPVKKNRPLGTSKSMRGSLKLNPTGIGSALFRSTRAVRDPVLVHTDALLFTVSNRFTGPAAIIVSGGSAAWRTPNAATWTSKLIIGNVEICVSLGPDGSDSGTAATAALGPFAEIPGACFLNGLLVC